MLGLIEGFQQMFVEWVHDHIRKFYHTKQKNQLMEAFSFRFFKIITILITHSFNFNAR